MPGHCTWAPNRSLSLCWLWNKADVTHMAVQLGRQMDAVARHTNPRCKGTSAQMCFPTTALVGAATEDANLPEIRGNFKWGNVTTWAFNIILYPVLFSVCKINSLSHRSALYQWNGLYSLPCSCGINGFLRTSDIISALMATLWVTLYLCYLLMLYQHRENFLSLTELVPFWCIQE